ncbi:MAG TPA: APC family permease [Gemmatimonadaceae bacterium]|nr:APC family permease [Gemmatimonadaceae bacterium]
MEPTRNAPGGAGSVRNVQQHSTELRRELGLGDLVLTQLMYVVGSGWVGTAAKLGHAQVVYWLLAIALFYLPQAAVVIYLNRLMPLEGGLYQWAKVGFNEGMGFLVGWNLWVYTLILLSAFGLMVATTLGYVIGPSGAWFTSSKWYDGAVTGLLIGSMILVSTLGLRVGKWVHNAGGLAQALTFTALIVMPYIALARGTLPAYHPLQAQMPPLSLLSVNIFGKMAMGALSGFEYVAILAGETRNPERAIGRSVMIATPLIAMMFILGTSAVVAVVPAAQVDLISPIPQALTLGFRSFGIGAVFGPALAGLLLIRHIANVNYIFAGNTRLPVVAGWDGLLPAWFTRLHPKYRTPLNSILFVAGITLAFAVLGLVGVGLQEAFQLLDNAAGILYALTYLAMFALPLFGLRAFRRAPPWLRLAAASGLAVTVLYTVLSVLPIIDVPNVWSFALKIGGVVVGTNLVGVALFRAERRRRNARPGAGAPPAPLPGD